MWSQIKDAATAAARDNNQNITDTLQTGGWAYAGSWQSELGRVKDAIDATVAGVKVEYTPAQNNLSSSLSGDLLAATQPLLNQSMATARELTSQALEAIRKNQGAQVTRSKSDFCRMPMPPVTENGITAKEIIFDGGSLIKQRITSYFNHSIGDSVVSCIIGGLSADGTDPILKIKGIGDTLISVSDVAIGSALIVRAGIAGAKAAVDDEASSIPARAAGVVTGGTANAGLVGIATGFLKYMDLLVEKASGALLWLFYLGYFLAIWVPMVPFLVFALGVVGWLVVVVEAVAASSLWMVMHISPEGGDGFVGGQKQGYLLLMSVFFRPVLMVLGLVASMAITIPVMDFLNAGFLIKMKSLQVNAVTGIISITGYLAIYCFLVYSALMLIYGLPQTLPDRILRWIGGGIGDLGEQASVSKIERGASAQAKTAAMSSIAKGLSGKESDKGSARLSQTRLKGREES